MCTITALACTCTALLLVHATIPDAVLAPTPRRHSISDALSVLRDSANPALILSNPASLNLGVSDVVADEQPWEMLARVQESQYLTCTAVDHIVEMCERRHLQCRHQIYKELCNVLPAQHHQAAENVCLTAMTQNNMWPELHNKYFREKAWRVQSKYQCAEPKRRVLGINVKTGQEDYVMEVRTLAPHPRQPVTTSLHKHSHAKLGACQSHHCTCTNGVGGYGS
jgi:hypothetical protein